MSNPIRANVLRMNPYSPGKPIAEVRRELGLERVVKLASNENPLGPSPKAVAAVKLAAETMHSYPDGASHDIRHKIAERFGISEQNVIVGNGSDDIIQMLGIVFLSGPDDEIVVGDPSFICYDAAAHLADCKLVKVPLDQDQKHDLAAMAKAVTPKTKLVFIANPNNPTGTIVSRDELDAFLEKLPESVTVILDEAYFEFAEHIDSMPNSVDYVKAGRRVVGMRTLSKAYGLAGLRLGYAFVPDYVKDAYDRARQPFHVNALAQAGGSAALDDLEHLQKTLETNTLGGLRIAKALEAIGAKTWPSYANFVWAEFSSPTQDLVSALLHKGVIVRSGAIFGKPHCLRVSIGTPDEIDFFIASLNAVDCLDKV